MSWQQGQMAAPHVGASLLSFGLERGVESYRPEKSKISINPVWWRIYWESNANRTNLDFPFFRPVSLLRPLGVDFWGGTRGVKSEKKSKRFFEKTRVGFGSPELSLRLSCTEFCVLSSGHGPKGQGFEGGEETLDVHNFLDGTKSWKCRMNMVRF